MRLYFLKQYHYLLEDCLHCWSVKSGCVRFCSSWQFWSQAWAERVHNEVLHVPLAEVGRYAAVTAAVQHGRVWRHAGALSLWTRRHQAGRLVAGASGRRGLVHWTGLLVVNLLREKEITLTLETAWYDLIKLLIHIAWRTAVNIWCNSPSCASSGSWDVCRTCRTVCTGMACQTCAHACASSCHCCWQSVCRSPRTHTGMAFLLQKNYKQQQKKKVNSGELIRNEPILPFLCTHTL